MSESIKKKDVDLKNRFFEVMSLAFFRRMWLVSWKGGPSNPPEAGFASLFWLIGQAVATGCIGLSAR